MLSETKNQQDIGKLCKAGRGRRATVLTRGVRVHLVERVVEREKLAGRG